MPSSPVQANWFTYDFQGHTWLADWIAAVGVAVGAIGTFAAVVVALRAGSRAERLRDEESRDRDAAQARLVTLQVAGAPYRDPQPPALLYPAKKI